MVITIATDNGTVVSSHTINIPKPSGTQADDAIEAAIATLGDLCTCEVCDEWFPGIDLIELPGARLVCAKCEKAGS